MNLRRELWTQRAEVLHPLSRPARKRLNAQNPSPAAPGWNRTSRLSASAAVRFTTAC